MPLQPTAEYSFEETFVYAQDSVFLTHSTEDTSSCANLYRFPNVLIVSFKLKQCSAQSLIVTLSKTESTLRIKSEETLEEITYEMDPFHFAVEDRRIRSRLSVRNSLAESDSLACRPTVYIGEQSTFAIEEKEIEGFYYSPDRMKLYTYSPSISTVKEYSLFMAEKIHPSGFSLLFDEYMKVYLPNKRYTLPIEYTEETDVSLFHHKNTLYSVFSYNGLIMYRNQFKKYPNGFIPSKIWNKHAYIYVFSAEKRTLLVLNRRLEIEYEIGGDNVFVTDEYVFISKREKTVAHCAKTFAFAFILEDFSVTDGIQGIFQVRDLLLVVSSEKALDKDGMFSFFITKIEVDRKTVKKMTLSPSISDKKSEFDVLSFSKETEMPYLTRPISDISFIVGENGYMGFCLCSDSVYAIWPEHAARISLSLIRSPFSEKVQTDKDALPGLLVRIDSNTGIISIVGKDIQEECIFPALVSQCISSRLSVSLLFSLFEKVPEYVTSVEKTLFHFLHNENIEEAIDLIDAVKSHGAHIYEKVVSTMTRLLDENNLQKMYSIIDKSEIKYFTSAEALSKALVTDFSLFDRFLRQALAQNREDLVFNFISFAYKIEDQALHKKLLSSLLKKNMLYTSAALLSNTTLQLDSSEVFPTLLISAYTRTNLLLLSIQETKEPAERLEEIFTGKDSLLIAMTAECLKIAENHPSLFDILLNRPNL